MGNSNISYLDKNQIELIKQAMDEEDRLKELYGDSIEKIEANSKRLPAV